MVADDHGKLVRLVLHVYFHAGGRAVPAAVTRGIIQHIVQAALDAQRPCPQRSERFQLAGVNDAHVLSHVPPVFLQAFQQGGHVQRRRFFGGTAPGQIDGCVHELLEFTHVSLELLTGLFIQAFHPEPHAGQRRAQIVGNCGQSAFTISDKIPDAALHAVECPGCLAHFTRAAFFQRRRAGEIPAQLVRCFGQTTQGAGNEPECQHADGHKEQFNQNNGGDGKARHRRKVGELVCEHDPCSVFQRHGGAYFAGNSSFRGPHAQGAICGSLYALPGCGHAERVNRGQSRAAWRGMNFSLPAL